MSRVYCKDCKHFGEYKNFLNDVFCSSKGPSWYGPNSVSRSPKEKNRDNDCKEFEAKLPSGESNEEKDDNGTA